MEEVQICMTATIVPNTTHVQRSEVSARLADYKTCIDFYLNQTGHHIHFLENSSYDLSRDEDFNRLADHPRFHLHRFEPHPSTDKGKGFQEFYTLDRFVNTLSAEALIVKVTGRYLIANIAPMLPLLRAPLNIDRHLKMKVAITGFFAVQQPVYQKYIRGLFQNADDEAGRFIEHVLYDKIENTELKNMVQLLPKNPRYIGISGSHGASMERNKYKMQVRGAERILSRRLGISQFLIEY